MDSLRRSRSHATQSLSVPGSEFCVSVPVLGSVQGSGSTRNRTLNLNDEPNLEGEHERRTQNQEPGTTASQTPFVTPPPSQRDIFRRSGPALHRLVRA